jgi:hypothetical protein
VCLHDGPRDDRKPCPVFRPFSTIRFWKPLLAFPAIERDSSNSALPNRTLRKHAADFVWHAPCRRCSGHAGVLHDRPPRVVVKAFRSCFDGPATASCVPACSCVAHRISDGLLAVDSLPHFSPNLSNSSAAERLRLGFERDPTVRARS